MADQAELAFVKTFVNTISSQPVTYSNDYQQPPENSLKKLPVLPIPVPAPPTRVPTAPAASSAPISVTFKSLKPPASFTIAVQPTDSIAAIKSQLAAQPNAPPADAQRLLLKGKALADAKLLKEYPVADGDTINLVLKPGTTWDPAKPAAAPTTVTTTTAPESMATPSPSLSPVPSGPSRRGHQRIPSVVLSPSPSSESLGAVEKDILLTLDSATIPGPVHTEPLSTYGATVAQPEFWERLYAFLKSEFTTESDALTAFEDYLRASKGSLTASQIAKIRDQVGIVGMAGT
ncbi:putative ubiquitin homologues [Lyophyllum shimeji]|uniref:Ubiquitin homologues n=1 Tax=Lyophyllum shimeji TaxID=47721 RepID=A0A9P3UTP6_LYOSH|nr:putative ubiquitin homologues [Lyophyllum shimeji]